MSVQLPSQYEERDYVMKGGMARHLSLFKYVNGGFYLIKGMHGDDEEALTKWNGAELFSSSNLGSRVVGLFQVVLNSNTYYFAVANGKVYRVDGMTLIEMLTGQAAGYYSGRTIESVFYLASGTNPNKKILGDLSIHNVGIVPPTATPVAADGGAGALTGDYTYRYTFKNALTGQESNPSPVSNTLSVTSKQITLTGLADSADPQVDRKVIYRTTGTGAGVWFRVTEITGTATNYTDNLADSGLAEELREDNAVPPQAQYLEVYNGMLAYAGLATPNQNRVAMSGVLRPEAHDPEHVYDLEPDEADQISGMKRFAGALAIYKERGLFFGTGRAPDEMEFVPTRVKEGALGNNIVEHQGVHFYLSQRGPFAFAGLQEDFFGRPIQDFYKTLDRTSLANASGVFYEPLNLLIWNVQETGQSDYNTWLCFNVQTKEWTIRDFASSRLSVYLDSFGASKLWLGGVNGLLYTGDIGTGDNGAAIAVSIITRGFCLKYINKQPDVSQAYGFRHLEIFYDANGGTAPVTVQAAIDKPDGIFQNLVNAATGASTFIPTTGTRVRFDLNLYGRLLFVKLTVSSTEALKIRGFRLQGYGLGRR